jgi:hypothetical protein
MQTLDADASSKRPLHHATLHYKEKWVPGREGGSRVERRQILPFPPYQSKGAPVTKQKSRLELMIFLRLPFRFP